MNGVRRSTFLGCQGALSSSIFSQERTDPLSKGIKSLGGGKWRLKPTLRSVHHRHYLVQIPLLRDGALGSPLKRAGCLPSITESNYFFSLDSLSMDPPTVPQAHGMGHQSPTLGQSYGSRIGSEHIPGPVLDEATPDWDGTRTLGQSITY
ncbi:hypothetical protein BDV93DRAFT_508641 [Ceratobasidium sp. AG-I]|nr:hypothetical protein BDV93DRAFT_508641 [Ceratobasidium sp. AG-I]